jgi:hypothetical protein
VAAVAIGAYHVFVEALFPATVEELFWILHAAAGFNMYGYYFRFTSLVRPSVYRQRYRQLREVAGWTRSKATQIWGRVQANRHLPVKYGRKALREEPLGFAWIIAAVLAPIARPVAGPVAYLPWVIVGLLVVYEIWQDGLQPNKGTSAEAGA